MWTAVASWYLTLSLVTFLVYGWDKRCARRQHHRVRERTLQGLALCGGWPGAWAGQQVFKHKRRKREFMLVFWGIVALHLLIFVAWGWYELRGGF